MNMQKTGKLIMERRKALGMTQTELGQRLHVTDKAVSKWERGLSCPDVELLNPLAAALELRLIELLSGELCELEQSSNRLAAPEAFVCDEDSLAVPVAMTFRPQTGTVVSPYLFGTNLEHTRADVIGGISAQMLKNRKFVGKPSVCQGIASGWYAIGDRAMFYLSEPYTRHAEAYHMKRSLERNAQRVVSLCPEENCGIGQHELHLQSGRTYEVRVAARASRPVELTVRLTSRHGNTVYAAGTLRIDSEAYASYSLDLCCPADDADADLRLEFADACTLDIGAVSMLPTDHFHGMRRDVIKCLREMGVRMLRWPGGNFAGEYNWMDGLLPVDMRAPFESYLHLETQPHSMGYDFHEINTDDFLALCRELGAEPFITINPAWNTPEENAAWVEYCNGGVDTAYGKLRAERGHPEPYNVQFWSLGNEYGYGHMEGPNAPDEYARIALENGKQMLAKSKTLSLCSSGPYPNDAWAELSVKPLTEVSRLVSLHYYSHEPKFTEDPANNRQEYYASLGGVAYSRQLARTLRRQIPDSVRISFDEWNLWYAWYRPSSLTDGIFTARMLHMFMEEAEISSIAVVCHFEAVNEGAIRAEPDKAYLTATGQAFSVMKHHANGTPCFLSEDAAATERDGMMTVTLVNASYDREKTFRLPAVGRVTAAKLYTGDVVTPPLCFAEQPLTVPAPEDGMHTLTLPPHSLALLQMQQA